MNAKVDQYLKKEKKWQEIMHILREVALDSGLTEELKWRQPCYTYSGHNIVIIQGFKEYCALMFFKGALLKDAKKILEAPGSAQAARQARFSTVTETKKLKSTLKSYIKEAMKIEDAGLKVEFKETKDFTVPAEFQKKLDKSAKLKKAFNALTPGRQRGYLYFISSAKQSATREARVEKCIPQILEGKGLND